MRSLGKANHSAEIDSLRIRRGSEAAKLSESSSSLSLSAEEKESTADR